ncbi:unnamed protein product [Mesocestoides corti]|nr:unnamed protein product [Mesocestoides corti]
MSANRSALGSVRALSLSTENLNKEQSLIAIPPPMCNLPYDPPHLSRWQQVSQRHQGLNTRSGSAVASRVDASSQQLNSKTATLNDQFRALTLHPRNHFGDPHRASTVRPGILNATIYELSDDLRAKEVDLMERYYGGRLRAQRAARVIQTKYREYRMRAQYAKLRSDRRWTDRRTTGSAVYYPPEEQREGQHLASMEDLVIDRAYLDWESEAAGSPGGGSIPDLTVEGKSSRSSAPSAATQPAESVEISSQSCSNLTTPKNHHQSSSPGTGTGSTSGFVSSPGSCSSGSLPTESTPLPVPCHKQEPVNRQPPETQSQPVVYYLLDRDDQHVSQHVPQQQLYVAVPAKPDQQYLKVVPQQQQPQRYLTQPTTAAVLVRRSSTGSNPRQAPVWCTPDGKMYTLAYAEKPKAVMVSPPPSSVQPVFVTPIRKDGVANTPVLVKIHQSPPPTSLVQMAQKPNATSSPVVGDRWRKRLYRVCLNYFNKSPVKGIDMLIKFRFLDASPRQIARFLLTRRGLSRSAIGEYLGEMKQDLSVATARQFIRELDFREKDVDEALRILMSRFRTPGESQKIVHLLTEFQSAYIEQNTARVNAQFRNPDSVMILAYAIVMLHTDMYSPNIRPSAKMTRQEFVKNLRGVDDGEDLDRNLLLAIYDRIQAEEMCVAPDHTDQVRKIHRLLTGPLRPTNLVLPQRRLVCYCRLYEVLDKTKRDRPGTHQREIFLFNDLLLVTKAFHKRRKDSSPAYQVRACITLLGTRVVAFETPYYANGISLYRVEQLETSDMLKGTSSNSEGPRGAPVICLNTKTSSDRTRLLEDLQECILETTEMDRVRLDDVLYKQVSPPKSVDTAHPHKAQMPTPGHFHPNPQPQYNPHLCKCHAEPTLQAAIQRGGTVCISAGLSLHPPARAFVYKTNNQSR